jgi:hypothetical protein
VMFHPYYHRVAALVLAARARGIPTVYAQHGVYFGESDCTVPMPFVEHLVFGEDSAENIGRRATGGPVTVTGHSLYDPLVLRGQQARQPRPEGERPAVLVATQTDETLTYDVTSEQWWVKGCAEACRELGAHCLIKLHPADTEVGMYTRLEELMPETVTVVRHGTRGMADLLDEAAVLVTRDSTVVYEANLAAVPVLAVNLTGRKDRVPYAAEGGALGVYRFEDLLTTLRRVLQGEIADLEASRQRFLLRHLGPQDGQAAERIAAGIARHYTPASEEADRPA